jgi:ABC-type lipoprotein export system ATPase subunit
MAIISAKHLSKMYGTEENPTYALRDASFEINHGEFVAIMGPSGSGKSTLLHILGFLDRHSDGEYRFRDKTIDDYSLDEIAHVRNTNMGFVFQQFNLLARASVLENVKLPLLYSGKRESLWNDIALKHIEAMGLSHRINHTPAQLSGGEKQRVAIARALVNDPDVIFADEPTGNLDSKTGRDVMEIIQDLNKEGGRTVILITHETYTAEHAKRIIYVQDGKVRSDEAVKRQRMAKEEFKK